MMASYALDTATSYRPRRPETWGTTDSGYVRTLPEDVYVRSLKPAATEVTTYQKQWSIEFLREKYKTSTFCNDLDDVIDVGEVHNSIESALAFLSQIGLKSNSQRMDLPYPELNPAEDDSVDLFWRGNPRLTVNFSNKLKTYGFFGKSQTRGTFKGIAPIGTIRSDILTWLTDTAPKK